VTVIICNILQPNYRSMCKLYLNYKLYNTLNIKTNKSTQRAQTSTTVNLGRRRNLYPHNLRNITGTFLSIDTRVIKFGQISDQLANVFQNIWPKYGKWLISQCWNVL